VNLPVGAAEKTLPCERLGKVLRSLGMAPTERQLSGAAVKTGGAALDFDQVLEVIADVADTPITEGRAKAAFAFFDGAGNGQISVDELRTILSTRGEPLPPDQLETWLAEADPEGKGYVESAAIAALCA
jgi:Ca2+-binding EF-hand superfamily protein